MRARAKIASTQGASFLLGLIVFFICAMAAASIVSAASANAQKGAPAQAQQQAYLTVNSAARLFAEELQLNSYQANGTVTAALYTCPYPHAHGGSDIGSANFDIVYSADGTSAQRTPLATLLEQGVTSLNPNDPTARFERSFTVQVPEFSTVSGVFRMYAEDAAGHGLYDVEITLQAREGDAASAMVVSAKADAQTLPESVRDTGSCAHYDQWEWEPAFASRAVLEPEWATANTPAFDSYTGSYVALANEFGHAVSTVSPVREQTSRQTVTWGNVLVTKGQVS